MIFLLPQGINHMNTMKMYPLMHADTVLDVMYGIFVDMFNSSGVRPCDIGVYYMEPEDSCDFGGFTCAMVSCLMGDYPPDGCALFCRYNCGPVSFLFYAADPKVKNVVITAMNERFGNSMVE